MNIRRLLQLSSLLIAGVGIILLAILGYFWQHSQRAAATPLYAPAKVADDPNRISGKPREIIIPSLNIDIPVIDGYYDQKTKDWTLTLNKAQYATPTVEPNNVSGNTLIYGHYRPEVFAYLHLIKPGAEAYIVTENGFKFSYKYQSTEAFDPADTSVLSYEGAPRLTVQTCSGSFMQHRQMYYFSFLSVQKAI